MSDASMICKFSGIPGEYIRPRNPNTIEYIIDVGRGPYCFIIEQRYYFKLTNASKKIAHNKDLVKALILNGAWPESATINSEKDFIKILSEQTYPKTPQQKLDNLFEYIFTQQNKDGEKIDLKKFWELNSFSRLYFKDGDECAFYLNTLEIKGLVTTYSGPIGNGYVGISKVSVTFDGLEYYNKITNEGLKSKNCFIAMSFSAGMEGIRQGIKNACNKTGYSPILIDETHGDSDKTINDEIIASIKKSKFCIADFTEQRDGVYFESGYALGRGLKVIYTCKADDFTNSHFDTNHFPHIIYNSPEELEEKLINKIEAWIKD